MGGLSGSGDGFGGGAVQDVDGGQGVDGGGGDDAAEVDVFVGVVGDGEQAGTKGEGGNS